MTAHKNGASQHFPTEQIVTPEASHPAEHRTNQVAAVVNVTGDLHLDDGTAFLAVAHHDLTLNDGGGAIFVAGEDFQLTNGGAAMMVAGRDFALRNGGGGFVLAGRDLTIANGEGSVSVAGNQATTTEHQSALIAAREVTLHDSNAGVIFAGKVNLNGNATVVVEITPERVAGAIVGLIFYLPVRLLQRMQGR